MENQDQSVAEFFMPADQECRQNHQLHDADYPHHRAFQPADKIKAFIDFRGMVGIDEFVERPYEHH